MTLLPLLLPLAEADPSLIMGFTPTEVVLATCLAGSWAVIAKLALHTRDQAEARRVAEVEAYKMLVPLAQALSMLMNEIKDLLRLEDSKRIDGRDCAEGGR